MISVLCANDQHLHLAPKEPGFGVSKYTLCLRKWSREEPCREDSKFCPECVMKWKAKGAE